MTRGHGDAGGRIGRALHRVSASSSPLRGLPSGLSLSPRRARSSRVEDRVSVVSHVFFGLRLGHGNDTLPPTRLYATGP